MLPFVSETPFLFGFEILTAAKMLTSVFWVVTYTSYSLAIEILESEVVVTGTLMVWERLSKQQTERIRWLLPFVQHRDDKMH
jgi:hypothetical protein